MVAPPGVGIEDTAPSASPTDQLKAFFERLRQTIERQIQEWRQQAEQELGRWLTELEQQVSEWIQRELERQVQSLVEQICGGSALAPMGLAIWLAARRRRK